VARPFLEVSRRGLGAYRMPVESNSENPLSALFGNLSWILPLAGVEQLVAWFVKVPFSDWRIGVVLLACGPVFHFLASGKDRITAKVANLPRLKIVKRREVQRELRERRDLDMALRSAQSQAKALTAELWHERAKVARFMLRDLGQKRMALKATVRFIDFVDGNQADHVVNVLHNFAGWECLKIRDDGVNLRRSQMHRIEISSGSPENAMAVAEILDDGRLLGEPVGWVEIIESADQNIMVTIFPLSSMPPS
jgi:hypothetical protein